MVHIIDGDSSSEDSGKAEDAEVKDETTGSLLSNQGRDNPNKDPLADQNVHRSASQDFREDELRAVLDTSWLKDRLIDDYANYATKEGFDINVEVQETAEIEEDQKRENLAKRIEKSILEYREQHQLLNKLNKQVEAERGTGAGFIYPLIKEQKKREVTEPLTAGGVTAIKGFNVFNFLKVDDIERHENPLSEDYKDLKRLQVQLHPANNIQVSDNGSNLAGVHPSRVLTLAPRWGETEPREPLSIFRRMRTLIMTLMNTEWAIGQVIYRMVWKVVKTDMNQFDTWQQKKMKERELQNDWDALSVSIIDEGDELTMPSAAANLGGINSVFEMFEKLLSASTAYPRSLLFGAQSGTISASDRDAKNFFQGVEGYQEARLTPILQDLFRFGWGVENGGIDNHGLKWSDVDIEVEWNDIFEISEESEAAVKNTEAQAALNTQKVLQGLQAQGLVDKDTALEAMKETGLIDQDTELPESDIGRSTLFPQGGPEGQNQEEQQEQQPEPQQNGSPQPQNNGTVQQ